jgi:multidrug efflux system outer membrane protein
LTRRLCGSGGVANMGCWEQFLDPVLDELATIALREHKDERIATARVVEFAARVDITRSGFFPQLGYGAQASPNDASREAIGCFAVN